MKAIYLLPLVFMFGCSAKYTTPQSGDRAQVRVVAPEFGGLAGVRIVYYENSNCDNPYVFGIISALKTTESDPGTSIPSTAVSQKSEHFDRYIKAGKTLMTINGAIAHLACGMPFEADFQKDKKYEILFYWIDDICYLQIAEFKDDEYSLIKEKILEKPAKPCYTGFSGSAL